MDNAHTYHTLIVMPPDIIVKIYRWTESLPRRTYIIMLDDWGHPIAQPWADPPRVRRGYLPPPRILTEAELLAGKEPGPNEAYFASPGTTRINYAAWFFNPLQPPEPLSRVDITEEQFWELYDVREEGAGGWSSFFCKRWNAEKRRIELRPGHHYTDWPNAEVCDPYNLELASIAYGGKPLYWLKWGAHTHPTDYSELLYHGMFHPRHYKPSPQIMKRGQYARQPLAADFLADNGLPVRAVGGPRATNHRLGVK